MGLGDLIEGYQFVKIIQIGVILTIVGIILLGMALNNMEILNFIVAFIFIIVGTLFLKKAYKKYKEEKDGPYW